MSDAKKEFWAFSSQITPYKPSEMSYRKDAGLGSPVLFVSPAWRDQAEKLAEALKQYAGMGGKIV